MGFYKGGNWEISKQSLRGLLLTGEGKVLTLEKFDQDRIKTVNSASGLEGIWEISDNPGGTGRIHSYRQERVYHV